MNAPASASAPSPSTSRPLAAGGRVLLVTGGSRGIGAATALRAAEAGWHVAVHARQAQGRAEAVAQSVRALGRQACVLTADVAREDEVVALFGALDRWVASLPGARLGGLVHSAGIVDVAQPVADMSGERLRRMVDTNVLGTMWCAREAVRRLSTARGGAGGALVLLSSAASRLGSPGQYVDYAATKAAVDTFTLGLAREVAAEGVRVNAVRPGIIDTEIHASGGQPDRARELAPQVPMRRPGTAEEVAHAIVWLLSDEAAYTTGALLDVSGGR